MANKALLIIDMLNDFIHPEGVLYCGESVHSIVPFIGQRLKTFRESDQTIIYLQDSHAPDDLEFEKFPPHCVIGTWGSRIIDELTPRPEEIVVAKTRFDGFFGTDLDSILSTAAPEKVEVTGVCTSICVMDTVGGVVNRGYRVRVPKAGVADFSPDSHDFALQRMQKIYGAEIL